MLSRKFVVTGYHPKKGSGVFQRTPDPFFFPVLFRWENVGTLEHISGSKAVSAIV